MNLLKVQAIVLEDLETTKSKLEQVCGPDASNAYERLHDGTRISAQVRSVREFVDMVLSAKLTITSPEATRLSAELVKETEELVEKLQFMSIGGTEEPANE